jgi:hypothetical protein
MITRKLIGFAVLPLLAACASAPPPTDRMASAESAVRAAREVGSDQVPQAQLLVKLAQEQIDQAKKASANGDNDKAQALLARATADAELGLAMAREQAAKTSAERGEQPQQAPSAVAQPQSQN